MAILCDGKRFYFFQFLDQRKANAFPQVSLGEFASNHRGISIDDIELNPSIDSQTFYRRLRRTCDSLYYVFLSGYNSGLEAYWNRSVERGKAQGKGRDSTPGWHKATVLARKALKEAMSAWDLFYEGKIIESKNSAERAVQSLTGRYMSRNFPSLVAVDANNRFLFTASKKLLLRRKSFCPTTRKIWRIYKASKGWTANLILLT